ncbi:dethiobiotin synthase [Moritella sp. 24]|uniref:dethiobiotin synthase n=1 Tax=Moritella sp. 24 TaxID=2746230 RepID=UPI001BA8905C|nr:dethiobiotin synthase [Moritella sp. 24]QUM76375.1 dethiobiotin synthase [Moritella sp. 24]
MTNNIKKVFITGTDTDVGKTVISTALIDNANSRGLKTVGFKPISAGCELTPLGLRNEDALLLQQHASKKVDYQLVNPIAYQAPIAPHIAAEQQGELIDLGVIDSTLAKITDNVDLVVIEGAGGWHLPIDKRNYFSSWVAENQLDVILVVGVKLGCLNHAILSAQAIQHSGANLVGWVANSLTADIANYDAMIETLLVALPAPLMGKMPYFVSIEDKNENSANYLDLTSYLAL